MLIYNSQVMLLIGIAEYLGVVGNLVSVHEWCHEISQCLESVETEYIFFRFPCIFAKFNDRIIIALPLAHVH